MIAAHKFGLLITLLVAFFVQTDAADAVRRCYSCRGSTSTMIDKLGSFDKYCHEPSEETTNFVDCPSESFCGKAITQNSDGQNVVIRRCLDPHKLPSAVRPGDCRVESFQGRDLLVCTCEEDLCNSAGYLRSWSLPLLLAFGLILFIANGFNSTG